MGIERVATYRTLTGEQLEEKGFAVSDDLIKKEREMNRILNEMEEELLYE